MRPAGYYWVRHYGEWTIGEYRERYGWQLVGGEEAIREADVGKEPYLQEVGPRVERPEGLKDWTRAQYRGEEPV